MKRTIQTGLIVLLGIFSLLAQSPKRELRAVWLTTAWANDWPRNVISADAVESAKEKIRTSQKDELTDYMDKLKAGNINTIYFQIRGMCDAMYKSSYEPWSQYLVSPRGSDPGYDPLKFAVEEAHKRGMELHAWVNPYRYSSSSSSHGNLPSDYAQVHPEWLLDCGGSVKILNPGLPEVRQRIVDVIKEVVANYDIDGVLFDDYFYVSGKTTESMDQAQFDAYNPDNLSRGDWRRQNVNKMVADVYRMIKTTKPHLTFGISPAGVASSDANVAAGHGVEPSPGSDWQYNGIFSDPLAWLKEGTVDYISPQLYWEIIGSSTSGMYERLTGWWSEVSNRFGRFYYSSNSISSMSAPPKSTPKAKSFCLQGEDIPAFALSSLEKDLLAQEDGAVQRSLKAAALTYSEMARQARLNREFDQNGAPGFVFFAAAKTVGNWKYPAFANFLDFMKREAFNYPSLSPAIPWMKAEEQSIVENISLDNKTLSWDYGKDNVRYAVYAVPNAKRGEAQVFSNPAYLLGISYSRQYTLPAGIAGNTHKIGVSVLDRYGNEYPVRVLGEALVDVETAALRLPENGAEVVVPMQFFWNGVEGADAYTLEVSGDAAFDELLYAYELQDTEFFSGNKFNLDDKTTYYWRIKTRKANMPVGVSEVRSFKSTKFKITEPADTAKNVSVTPVIRWMSIHGEADYTLEIASSINFYKDNIVYTGTAKTTELAIPEKTLVLGRTYYARVMASFLGLSAVSQVSSFTVEGGEVAVPVILSPADGALIEGNNIEVTWQEQLARGFWAELSQDNTFPTRNSKVIRTDAYTYAARYEGLDAGTYYIRVLASNSTGLTDPSGVVSVQLTGASGNKEIQQSGESCYCYYDADGKCNIIVSNPESPHAAVQIYSAAGMLIGRCTYGLHAGKNSLPLDMTGYAEGMYMVKVKTGNKENVIKVYK